MTELSWDDYYDDSTDDGSLEHDQTTENRPENGRALSPQPERAVAPTNGKVPSEARVPANAEQRNGTPRTIEQPPTTEFKYSEEERVAVEEKRMINCRADCNQLMPMKYKWAWDKYRNAIANNWTPEEVIMTPDIKLWNERDGLTEAERRVVKRSLGFFSTADSLVANNLVLAVYRLITNPECRQYILRQAFEEALHTQTYQYCIDALGLDTGEIFNMYHEIPSVSNKSTWAINYTKQLADPLFQTGTIETDRQLLENLIAFYCVVEGIFFYCGFSQILSMKRFNKMSATATEFAFIMRDESQHVNFGIDAINQIKIENPHLWDDEMKQKVTQMIVDGTALEIDYARDTMPTPIQGMKFEEMEVYLKYIANRRLNQIGLPNFYPNTYCPFDWMTEVMDLSIESNFFEAPVTEYQSGGALDWD